MRVPLFRWQHRLHRWTSHALLLRRHGPARRDSDAPTHRVLDLRVAVVLDEPVSGGGSWRWRPVAYLPAS